MKIPWPLYLAWKQLFPSQKKVFLLFPARSGWSGTWSKCYDCGGGFHEGLPAQIPGGYY